MALDTLVQAGAGPVFTDEERIAQTEKLIERAFGVPAADVGRVEMRDGAPVVVVSYKGGEHTLSWARDHRGRIAWTLDGKRPVLGIGGDNAAKALAAAIDALAA